MKKLRIRPAPLVARVVTPLLGLMAACGDQNPLANTEPASPSGPASVPALTELDTYSVHPIDVDAAGTPCSASGQVTRFQIKISDEYDWRALKSNTKIPVIVEGYDPSGARVTTGTYSWTMDRPEVAYVEGYEYGGAARGEYNLIIGKRVGEARLKITWTPFYPGSCTSETGMIFTVVPGDVHTVELAPATLTLKPGESGRFIATAYDYHRNRVASSDAAGSQQYDFTWWVGDANVVSLQLGGWVQANNPPMPPYQSTVGVQYKKSTHLTATGTVTVDIPECYCPPGMVCTCITPDDRDTWS